ncbi:Heavy metal-associated isoprenylated plant protein 8 [Glycine soja]|uniref:Heavy metal-associated isoprenylated plant protein 8 n=2 Tax=Glycine soja TaxID=3848 RepID=A0A445I4T7_GLYSO|nr:Heavy metal-associated isoprenylated plant protein 8 [Glycine soja]
MDEVNPIASPMVGGCKLSKSGLETFSDPTLYRSVVGALQYATITRPKLCFSINKVSLDINFSDLKPLVYMKSPPFKPDMSPPHHEKKDKGNKEEAKDKKKKEEPPPEIVLKVDMHCEACARKVAKALKGFQGVEEVSADSRTNKVVVKGKTTDPIKVCERLQKKSGKKLELISPLPKPLEEKEPPKEEPPKEEPPKEEKKI